MVPPPEQDSTATIKGKTICQKDKEPPREGSQIVNREGMVEVKCTYSLRRWIGERIGRQFGVTRAASLVRESPVEGLVDVDPDYHR
jgi:hypothetical protein